jgi:hypothetical protein
MKHILATAVLTLALPLLTPGTAVADREHNPEFSKLVRTIEENPDAVEVVTVYDVDAGPQQVDPAQFATLTEIAKDQAQIWGDTILEGEYEADGNTTLDRIEQVKLGETFVGYRIVYSEKGWNTAACRYNGRAEELTECQQGRIQEASFVSPELNSWTRDSNSFAEFID